MKLVIKADDFGYTKTYNDGTIEAIENGIVTVADLMLDTPGTEDAIERIKNYPWITVGWHGSHFWGSPVADPKLVPSMVDPKTGKFKFRKNSSLKATVVYEEALIECRAQIEKCIRLLGRVPDIARIHDDIPLEYAKKQICDEYGINYTYEEKLIRLNKSTMEPDPVGLLINSVEEAKTDNTYIGVFHAGYLDAYIASESSLRELRPLDAAALCSEEVKNWIRENRIELVNMHDVLYGTHEYQNYLKAMGSDLCVRQYSSDETKGC